MHNSWLDPKKVRQMTVVGSQRMIVYDDTEPLEKLKIYDARVEVPPHYDTFAEFTYSYHYGDAYIPYIKQDEPLKLECQHFLDCVSATAQPAHRRAPGAGSGADSGSRRHVAETDRGLSPLSALAVDSAAASSQRISNWQWTTATAMAMAHAFRSVPAGTAVCFA